VSEQGDKKRFWVGFNRVPGIGPARLENLLNVFGDIEAAWNASATDLEKAKLAPRYVQALLEARDTLDLDEEMESIEEAGFHVVTWHDKEYPERLRETGAPPPVLYIWGQLEMRDLISGLARGIDGISHKAALDAGGRTIAVLGSGLDEIYPPEHRNLAEKIAKSGAVVSDYPMGTKPEGRNFPPRNRIISGLSLAVVIVEAGEGSGALITADFAAEQGRELYAVPGSLYSRASRGTHALLLSGARPLTSVDDLLEGLNLDLVARHEQAEQELPEDEKERSVYKALTSDPIHVDEIQLRCGLPVSEVTATLALLELKGRVQQVGGMQYIRAREARAGYRVE
jgi:DNA processing protein